MSSSCQGLEVPTKLRKNVLLDTTVKTEQNLRLNFPVRPAPIPTKQTWLITTSAGNAHEEVTVLKIAPRLKVHVRQGIFAHQVINLKFLSACHLCAEQLFF